MSIRVGINGYGTIGKRVAYAISKQDDMKVAGVVKHTPDFEARFAAEKGFDVYVTGKDSIEKFEKAKQFYSDLLCWKYETDERGYSMIKNNGRNKSQLV